MKTFSTPLVHRKTALMRAALGALFAGLFIPSQPSAAATAASLESAAQAVLKEGHREFLLTHCVECHGEKKQEGKVRLDQVGFQIDSVQLADLWQKILNAVNSGDMPPEEAKQPRARAKADFLEDLSQTLASARRVLSDSGGRSLVRRLNRREYQNTIRDLLGIDVAVDTLPPDTGSGTFDTVGSSLFLSSDQLEQYLALGRRALQDAFTRHASDLSRTSPLRLRVETEQVANRDIRNGLDHHSRTSEPVRQWWAAVDLSAGLPENAEVFETLRELPEIRETPMRFYRHWSELAGAPSPKEFGFKDAAEAEMKEEEFERVKKYSERYLALPRVGDGSYLFVFRLRPEEKIVPPASWPPGRYTLRFRVAALEGVPESWHFIEVGRPTAPGAFDVLSAHQISGTLKAPQTLEVPITLTSTDRRGIAIREKRLNSREKEVALWVLHERKHNDWRPPSAWIDWMELEGPLPTAPLADLFAPMPIRELLGEFARKAFRGAPPRPEFLDGLVQMYENRRSAGEAHEKAVVESLAVVLASPGFLYLAEAAPGALELSQANKTPEQKKESSASPSFLTQRELASRLSYFLWSAPPDAELLASRNLDTPGELTRQINRMIDSPKIEAFTEAFVQQWLGLERLNFFQFDSREFPGFDDSFKAAARSEVIQTFAHLLRTDQSLKQLLKSENVRVNGLLAQFYGLKGVHGDKWETVSLPNGSPRGGLLGMSAILAMGSNGERTSPVERGAWILRKILHEPPPPAPPNIPQLSRLSDRPLSPRERIAAHQELPQCTHCHRKIDPIGFGLENFDAMGAWRTSESYRKVQGGRGPWPIDASGALYRGAAFRDYFELRELLAARMDNFAQVFTEALIEYALGRPFGISDSQLAADLVAQARNRGYSTRAFLEALVTSQSFRSGPKAAPSE